MTQGNRRGSSVGGIRGSAILMTVRSGAVKRRVRAWRPQARALGVMALAWLLTLAPLPWPVPPVMAATFTVNTTADTEDASPGNGVCADSSGNCSLRAAIMEANALSGADTIVLQSGQTYTLSKDTDGNGHATDSGANNDDLDVLTGSTIIIQGNGATIRRASTPTCNLNGTTNTGEFRIFEVRSGGNLTLQNVTVRNGCADGSGANNDGGGILNNAGGTLTVINSTISGNSADDGGGGIRNAGNLTIANSTISGNSADDGGGISNAGGTLTVINSTISGNSADGGGGISNAGGGTVTVTNSTISGNSTSSSGGGISNFGGTVTITNSTISANSAADDGGGILNNTGGTLTVINSTISGNSADDGGGGIRNAGNLTIANSTISGNSADDGGGILNSGGMANLSFVTIASNPAGGGISHSGGTVNIKNSIVGNNTPNCSGTVTATGANFATDGSCAGFNNVPSTGPGGLNLGPLANNGGPTQTHALQVGSAAIDAVTDCTDLGGNAVTQDQRGVSRPQSSACDVGAYEASLFTLTVTLTGTGTGTVTSNPTGINCPGDCSESYPENTVVTLTATPASGSTFAGWSGGCSGSSPTTTVTMNADKTCTATFQLPTTGTIVIQKQTTESGGTFSFTATGTGLPSSFSLTTPSGGGTASQTFNVSPGTKTVTEQFVPGWVLTNLVCSDPDGGTTVNVGTRTATIDLDPGETITCTFTNTQGVTLEGGGNCLQLNLQARTYRFRTNTGDLFTGSIRFTRRGSVIQFSNLRMPGETGTLGGTVNLTPPGRGQAVLRTFSPRRTFSITDPNLSDNTCVP